MALPTFESTNFGQGFYKLARFNPGDSNRVQAYIDQYYPKRVRDVVGDEAYIEIRDQDPLKQKWVDLFQGVDYFNTIQDKTVIQEGLLETFKGVLYFDFLRNGFDVTDSGNVAPLQEVSASIGEQKAFIACDRWNFAIKKLCQEIVPFLIEYESQKQFILNSVENLPGEYTINLVPSSVTNRKFYLFDNETVKINSGQYTVQNVVPNASFDIVGDAGLDFSGQLATWEPFKDFPVYAELPYSYLTRFSYYYGYNRYNTVWRSFTGKFEFKTVL